MSRAQRFLLVCIPVALPLLVAVTAVQAEQQFGYDEAERQQELLQVWFDIRKSNAEKGDPAAMFDVGMAHYTGRGTPVAYTPARRWFQRAADVEHARAHYFLGHLFAGGKGTEADPERSREHYTRAAELGDADAQYWLGSHLVNDAQKPAAGREWLTRAAEQGMPAAQYFVGYLHEFGKGTRRNPATAAEWYQRAAEQGNRSAQIGLGRLYQNGRGVKRDLVQAHVWYRLAQDADRLEALEARMNSRDLASARARFEEQKATLQAAAAR